MTTAIKKEIEFYEKYKPYEMLKNGIFGSGMGIKGEYLIPMKIDIKKENMHFQDEFEWDILSQISSPELFAKAIVAENDLDSALTCNIAMDIRRQIRNYIYNLCIDFSATLNEDKSMKISKPKKLKKKPKKSGFELPQSAAKITKNFSSIPLKNILGKKRNRNDSVKYDNTNLPLFLQNTQDSLNIYESYYDSTLLNKNSEYLVDANSNNIIIKKTIFLNDLKDFLSKE